MDINFENKMSKYAKELNIELSQEQLKEFYDYLNLLLEWNEKINLTAITEINEIILKHFIDSLTIAKYLKDSDNFVDVGTGAGFPGIPIAIWNNTINITLLDSLNKRILFLNDVINKLDLKNIKTIHGRAEEFGQNKQTREKYDVVTSRAVANLTTLSEYLLPIVKVGGKCICMKGSNIDQELDDAKFAIKEFGGEIKKIEKFVLPDSDIERNIIIINKMKETPKKYPRKAGMPSKEPLRK